MHILQILHDRERGGVQTLAAMIEDDLRQSDVAVETLYLFPGPGLPAWGKLWCAIRMAYQILTRRYDALLAYQATASILVGVFGLLKGCRLRIVHQTCTPADTAWPVRRLDRLVGSLGFYTVNIANSRATLAEFDGYPARYRRSIQLIEHGLDPPVPTRSRAQARLRFGLPLAAPLLLNVGRLVAQKNQRVLIRAVASLPGVHLALAGGGLDEPDCRALAQELGMADRVHFLGVVAGAEIGDLYAAADLFVMPSTWETFGLAAVEAAMVGLPAVVSALPVLREVLSLQGAELVDFVDPHDVPGWTKAISAALAHPPDAGAKQRFAQAMARKYSRARMIAAYQALLQSHHAAAGWAKQEAAS